MQLNMTRRARMACVAAGLAAAVGALTAADAAARFSTGQYTYSQRTGSGCRHHVDPINVVFYGSRA